MEVYRPILCLTIFKNKMAQLLVARLSTTQLQLENETVQGAVSLKYVVNPSPLDLKTVEGVQSLATRLYYIYAGSMNIIVYRALCYRQLNLGYHYLLWSAS